MQKLKYESFSHLSESVLKKLAHNRITTILEFLEEDVFKLSVLTSLSLPQILTIRSEIFAKYSAPLINGNTILARSQTRSSKISTGIKKLDAIIGGGIPVGYLTELCGLADSGKTQLSLQLAINCVIDKENAVLYVDTKGDFSAIRLQKILEANKYSYKDMAVIMYKIKVVHIWIMEELIDLFKSIKEKTLGIDNLVLIIVDSLPCLMFQYLGDDSKIGLSFLNTLVNYSRYLSTELYLGIIFVNIQTRWIGSEVPELEDDGEIALASKEASATETRNRSLGRYWQEIPALVLELEKVRSVTKEISDCTQLKISVMKSYEFEDCQCILNIDSGGVT